MVCWLFSSIIQFMVTFVYAGNSPSKRKGLWDSNYSLASTIKDTWLVLSDFNCSHTTNEKVRGCLPLPRKLVNFNSYIFNSRLLDLPNTCLSFSWFNH